VSRVLFFVSFGLAGSGSLALSHWWFVGFWPLHSPCPGPPPPLRLRLRLHT